MQKKFVGALYVLNIVGQAIFTLLTPTALMFFIAFLFIRRIGAPEWLYAVLIPIGFIAGFCSMIKFVISASEGLNRLEKQQNDKRK